MATWRGNGRRLASQLSQLKAIQSGCFGGGSSGWVAEVEAHRVVGGQEQQQQPLTPAFC